MRPHRIFAALSLFSLYVGAAQPGVSPKSETALPAVYFLGVDQLPAGAEGERLAALYSATPTDRWALTDKARQIAAGLDSTALKLDTPLDRWNPRTDPYNFGVISLRDASHTTLTWQGSNSRTLVRMDLTWLQIGHEQQTRMQKEKLPELRFTVSLHDISEFNSELPPTAQQLQGFYSEAFTAAVTELLKRVNKRYVRELNRSAAQVRYVTVAPPVVLAPAAQQVARFFASDPPERSVSRISEAIGAYLEHQLLENLWNDPSFDEVVLLPSAQVVAYLQAEWSTFARRVTALSDYNANLKAIDFQTPRLLQVVPLCNVLAENQVHALEIRSNLTEVQLKVAPENAHVEWVTLTSFLAADVKIALDAERSRQPLPAALPPLLAHTMSTPMKKPTDIAAIDFMGPQTLQWAITKAADPLASAIAARLRNILQHTPPLSHPSYQESCHEE